MRLFCGEAKKSLLTQKGLLILCLCLLLKVLTLSFFPEQKDQRILLSQKQYDKYLEQLHGESSPEKNAWILQEYENCKNTIAQREAMEAQHLSGEITEEQWQEYTQALNDAYLHLNSAQIFAEKAEQFEAQDPALPKAHYIYEYGWETVFTILQLPDLFLLFALLILTAQCFSAEATGGMLPVLLAARDGRRRLYWTKLLALLAISLGAAAAFSGAEVLVFSCRGFLNDPDAPLYSVSFMTDCRFDSTLIRAYWLQLGIRGAATLSFLALTYGLSIWLRNTTNLLFLGLCLLALPLVWNQTLCLFTHGGLLTGSKTLLWLGSSGWNPMAPAVVVLGYTLPVILLAERRHQRGL